MYIDTHAHLNFEDFENDLSLVVERANSAGVKKIVVPSSDLKLSRKSIEIAKNYKNIYAAIGLHPIHVSEGNFNEDEFLKLAKNKNVVAIGETGLDYYHDKNTAFLQQAVLGKLINIANVVHKPIILHSRDSGDDLLSVLTAQSSLPSGVLHCFSEDLSYAKVILDMGFYISFTGIITFSKNQNTIEVIKEIPLEKILIETDSPYLAPEAYRGKRNEPAYVVEVAKKIAEIKKIPLAKVAEQTAKNAEKLFKI